MQFEESVVHMVSKDPAGAKRLTHFFQSKGLSVVCFKTVAKYIAAQRDGRPACLILDLRPSAKYPFSRSALMFVNGRTAMEASPAATVIRLAEPEETRRRSTSTASRSSSVNSQCSDFITSCRSKDEPTKGASLLKTQR